MGWSSPQLVKEARQLAWPWTILMLAGLVVLARPSLTEVPVFLAIPPNVSPRFTT